MNQVFDLKRWLLLVNKHWGENRKKYLLSMVALAALMIIWYLFLMMVEQRRPYDEDIQTGTYFIGMAITGCLFASLLFSEAASGPRAMHFMSVPASIFEKLLCAMLYGIVLFFITYTLIFYIVDFAIIKVSNAILASYWEERGVGEAFQPQTIANVFAGPGGQSPNAPPIFFWLLLMYFNLQSAFILGSIYFPGYSFIKTCISLLVVFLLVIFYMAVVLDDLMPPGHFGEGFFTYLVPTNDESVRGVTVPKWISYTVKYLLMYGFLPLLWLATYFRLKEKEV